VTATRETANRRLTAGYADYCILRDRALLVNFSEKYKRGTGTVRFRLFQSRQRCRPSSRQRARSRTDRVDFTGIPGEYR